LRNQQQQIFLALEFPSDEEILVLHPLHVLTPCRRFFKNDY
jgi:hypothetical protein